MGKRLAYGLVTSVPDWWAVTSGVPQGSILSPGLLGFLTKDLGSGAGGALGVLVMLSWEQLWAAQRAERPSERPGQGREGQFPNLWSLTREGPDSGPGMGTPGWVGELCVTGTEPGNGQSWAREAQDGFWERFFPQRVPGTAPRLLSSVWTALPGMPRVG